MAVEEIGDLRTTGALETIYATGLTRGAAFRQHADGGADGSTFPTGSPARSRRRPPHRPAAPFRVEIRGRKGYQRRLLKHEAPTSSK